jgi:hypothetical protein
VNVAIGREADLSRPIVRNMDDIDIVRANNRCPNQADRATTRRAALYGDAESQFPRPFLLCSLNCSLGNSAGDELHGISPAIGHYHNKR